jgi:hypothetical protein
MDASGSSSYQNLQLPVGQHSFQYVYSGDSSYLPTSRSAQPEPLNFTITKAPAIITSRQTTSGTLNAGESFVYQVLVTGVGGGEPPAGGVTFTFGDLPPQIVDLRPQVGGPSTIGTGVSYAAAYLTNLPTGTYPITVSYSGDRNWEGSVFTGPTLTVAGPSTLLPSITTATLTSSSGSGPIEPSTTLIMNVTVSGGQGATVPPTGLFVIVDEGTTIAYGLLTPSLSGTTSSGTESFRGSQVYGGTNQLLVLYLGDSNYQLSYSPLISYTDHTSDFTLAATTQNITLRSGGSGVGFLQLQGLESFNGGVSLSCTVTGGPTGNTVMPSCAVPPVAIVQTTRPSTSILLVNTESRGQRQSVPPGTYTAVITGTTGVVMHNVSVTIVVQDPTIRW